MSCPKLLALRVLVGLLLVLLVLVGFFGSRGSVTLPWYLIAGGLFLLWAGVTALVGDTPRASFVGVVFRYEGVLGFAAYFVIFLAARRLASSRFWPGRLALTLGCVALALVGLNGVLQQVWPVGHPLYSLSLLYADRSYGTMGNPIFYGFLACLALPPLFSLLASSERSLDPYTVVAFGLLLAGGLFTYARSFWLAAPVGLILTAGLLLIERRGLRWKPVVIAVLLGVVVVMATNLARPESAPREVSATVEGRVAETVRGAGSLRSRIELYKGALALIRERPLAGWGLETYVPQGARVRTEILARAEGPLLYPDRPHDQWLYIAYATGVPGLALYLVFFAGAFWAALRGYWARSGAERALSAGLLGGLIAYTLAELTAFSVLQATPVFWALLGWATVQSQAVQRAEDDEREVAPLLLGRAGVTLSAASAKVLTVGGALVTLLWAAFAVPHAVNVFLADHTHQTIQTRVLQAEEYQRDARHELEAARRDPYSPYYWNIAAEILSGGAKTFNQPADLVEAERVLREGLRFNPDDPTLVVSLSAMYAREGRPDAVARLLEPYLAKDKYMTDAHFNIAEAYLNLNEPRMAAAHLEAVVNLVPTDAEAFSYLARAYRALGRLDDATIAQQKAAALDRRYTTGSGG